MIVLDTHIWHWWLNQIPGKLSPAILTLIEETDDVGISAISCFEMAWLVRHGRIDLGMPFEQWFDIAKNDTEIQILPVTAPISIRAVALPEHHKDPQDRIIISTAIIHNAKLLSYDSIFSTYRELDECLIGKK
jgi:PIN domain nuclease of toxin-antitoxin system